MYSVHCKERVCAKRSLFSYDKQKDDYVRHCAHGRYGSHNHTSHITQPPGRGVHISFAGSVCTTTTHESRRCTGHGIHTSVPRHATRPNCAKMCAHARRNNRPTRKHNLRPRPPQRRIGFRARCQAHLERARVTQAAHPRPPRSQQHMITPWKTREQSIATQAHGRALTPLTS